MIQLLDKRGKESTNRISIVGLGDHNTWRMAMKSQSLCDFLFQSIVTLLLHFETAADRKRFIVHEDMSNVVLMFMALAKGSKLHGDHNETSRCNYVSSLIGGVESLSEDETKSFITTAMEILSTSLREGSEKDQLFCGVAILDWFISQHFDKLNNPATLDPFNENIAPAEIGEGQELWYIVDGNDATSDRAKVTIIKVHTDDFPNLYFTIQLADESIKQTISSRLKKCPLPPSRSSNETKAFDKLIPWIEETVATKIVKPYLLHETDLCGNVAGECLNIILSYFGLSGGAGIGSLRYDIFQLLLKLEHQIIYDINEENYPMLIDHLRRMSLALGYGQITSPSENNPEIMKFNCKNLMTNLLTLVDKDEFSSFIRDAGFNSFNQSFLMWLSVSVKTSMDESNASQIYSIASEIAAEGVSQQCYEDNEEWLLMILRLIQKMQKAMVQLPQSLKAVTIDSEQTMMSSLVNIFVNCDHQTITSPEKMIEHSSSNGEDATVIYASQNPAWFDAMKCFTVRNLKLSPSSIMYGTRIHVEDLCETLLDSNKQWCSFQLLSRLSKVNDALYTKDDNLSSKTMVILDRWLGKLDEEEAAELEEDVLVTAMWIPRHLMRYLEDCVENEDDENELLLTSILLKFLLCLQFLDTATSSDMRNRGHISSYINMTGAVKSVMGVALHFAHLDKPKGAKTWLRSMSLENDSTEFDLADLSTLVLFRSAESIPTLFKSWWNEDCPRSMQSAINHFVEVMVAPETLRRELDRIRVASILDEMSVTGSCVSREVVATYMQDEVRHRKATKLLKATFTSYLIQSLFDLILLRIYQCQLSVMIRVPPSFPLRNVEVDCQKTLGIAEKRWRHWSLQIMLMLNSQDGSILDALMLWKQNVDKEFEGVEPCPVCYSVLCVKTHAMPNLECKTCHNRFHSSCLYKWFSSSGKNQCVLCQQPWSGTKVGK